MQGLGDSVENTIPPSGVIHIKRVIIVKLYDSHGLASMNGKCPFDSKTGSFLSATTHIQIYFATAILTLLHIYIYVPTKQTKLFCIRLHL